MSTADRQYIPAGSTLPAYTLIRSDRRSMEIRVTPFTGEIVLRIPRRTARKTAEAFLTAHLNDVLAAVREALSRTPDRMHAALADEEIRALRSRAAAVIPERVRFWCTQLALPMPDRISYTAAKQRFGSCRTYHDGRIHLCFSYRLMQFSPQEVDAVVLHEVAHMRYMDHSERFYALIRQHMPDYDERRAALKRKTE